MEMEKTRLCEDLGPLMASLDLTYRCNLRCRMCNVWKIARKERELDLEDWKNIVDQLVQAFSVRLFRIVGGEPFLHSGFKDIVHYIKTRGCRLTIVTNGTFIDKEMAHFLVSECVDRIRMSVNGLQETDDFYRGKGTFLRTMKGMEAILHENRLHPFHPTKLEVHPFVSKVNCDEMGSLLSLSTQLEADFSFHYLQGVIGERAHRMQDPGFPQDSQRPSIMSLEEKTNFEKRFDLLLPFRQKFPQALFSKIGDLPIWLDCARTVFHILVDPWGRVFPCENIYHYGYGNCRDAHIRKIWLSPKRRILRRCIMKGNLQVCRNCGRRRFIFPMVLAKIPVSRLNILPVLKFAER